MAWAHAPATSAITEKSPPTTGRPLAREAAAAAVWAEEEEGEEGEEGEECLDRSCSAMDELPGRLKAARTPGLKKAEKRDGLPRPPLFFDGLRSQPTNARQRPSARMTDMATRMTGNATRPELPPSSADLVG